MTNLATKYLGLQLKSPLVVSAGPLCRELDNLKKLEDAHAAAVVLHSLFEEQIDLESQQLDDSLWQASDVSAEAQNYYPELEASAALGPNEYLEHIAKAKAALKIPVIASLNGSSKGGWTGYAKLMQEAGADALELNIYFLASDSKEDAAAIENRYIELVQEVKGSVKIPVAVKIGPYFSSIANIGKRIGEAGADALVLFNRFYQPDFNLETMQVEPQLVLSNSSELTLRLHWAAILFDQIKADLAITGGVHTAVDVVKSMMAGARVTLMTSALLQEGIGHMRAVEDNLVQWLDEHEYESVAQMQGSMSFKHVEHPAAFQRANYMKTLHSYSFDK
jgi:dihydroorotate dehydrogenase (fumarate)